MIKVERMSDLIKSKDRVNKYGEVFTPDFIIEEMLNALDPNDIKDPEKLFFEPSAGNGNFLLGILKKRIENGIDIIVALNTMIGIELQMDNVLESHERLFEMCKSFVFKAKKKTQKEKMLYAKCIMIIKQNIFQGDSLVYMREKKILTHKFCYKPIKDSNALVLSDEERIEKMNEALEFVG
jgi:hypothetical protein